ncbi:MAG: hypothetical protein ACJAXY_000970 [Nonlabens sp.]|jgi:hypothetical protein
MKINKAFQVERLYENFMDLYPINFESLVEKLNYPWK